MRLPPFAQRPLGRAASLPRHVRRPRAFVRPATNGGEKPPPAKCSSADVAKCMQTVAQLMDQCAKQGFTSKSKCYWDGAKLLLSGYGDCAPCVKTVQEGWEQFRKRNKPDDPKT